MNKISNRLLRSILIVLLITMLFTPSVLAHLDPPGPPIIQTHIVTYVTIKKWSDPIWTPKAEIFVTAHINMPNHFNGHYGSAVTEDVTENTTLSYLLFTHTECTPATEVEIEINVWEEDGLPDWLNNILSTTAVAAGGAIGCIAGTAVGGTGGTITVPGIGTITGAVAGATIGTAVGTVAGAVAYEVLKSILGASNDLLGSFKFKLGTNGKGELENENVKVKIVRTDVELGYPGCELPKEIVPGNKTSCYMNTLNDPIFHVEPNINSLRALYAYGKDLDYPFSKYNVYAKREFETLLNYTQMTDIIWNPGEERPIDKEAIKNATIYLFADIAQTATERAIEASGLDPAQFKAKIERGLQDLKAGDVMGYFERLEEVYSDVVTKRFPEYNPPPLTSEELALVSLNVIDETGAFVKNLFVKITLANGTQLSIPSMGYLVSFIGFKDDMIRIDVGFDLFLLGIHYPIRILGRDFTITNDINQFDVRVIIIPGVAADQLVMIINYSINIFLISLLVGLGYKLLKRLREFVRKR